MKGATAGVSLAGSPSSMGTSGTAFLPSPSQKIENRPTSRSKEEIAVAGVFDMRVLCLEYVVSASVSMR